ncbi:Uncharacterized conserved protein YtfP, gamma-glutamylcyclotransferase (GGCT)/AIG2-like family [Burkholderia sp. D7]|nr:Uncharacterized conserved protein YtfP, gamma-glutamylcyclotransferase (GGCT)/AIG2-like family [Burkholderia sp. D7]
MQHVFVYGTLRAGESNDIRLAAERHGIAEPVLIGPGHINGRLYDFNAYPGLVLDSAAGPVRGDIYRIDETLVPVLDEIEEVVPGVIGLYRSERLPVAAQIDGRAQVIDCLIYLVGEEAVEGLLRIDSGDWIVYRRSR